MNEQDGGAGERVQARDAWSEAAHGLAHAPLSERVLGWIACALGGLALIAIGVRLIEAVSANAGAALLLTALVAFGSAAFFTWPLFATERGKRRARERLARARAADWETRCPRCDAPILARSASEAGLRECGGCGARLAEGEGLLIAWTDSERWRAQRWRSAAALRLRASGAKPVAFPGPALVLIAIAIAISSLAAIASAAGGEVGIPVAAEAALDPEPPPQGRANAEESPSEPIPPGSATRPPAPVWVGTSVLARSGPEPYHALAVIVRVDGERGYAVFADGEGRWVRGSELLAPELAPGDRIEVETAGRYVEAELVDRVGEALRVRRDDGTEEWTSASRMRVRADGAHRAGAGRETRVPPGAWVEARDRDGLWRPGVALDHDGSALRVALSDGSEVRTARSEVRVQHVGPGTRIVVRDRPVIVARRLGHALAIVDAHGRRSWTSLARVQRIDR